MSPEHDRDLPAQDGDGGRLAAQRRAIGDGLAHVYRARYGRGPERSSVHITPDAVICVLQGVNTPLQEVLVAQGDAEVADVTHNRLQRGMADRMTELVEQVTGKRVVAYIPGFNAAAGATTDTFLLSTTDRA